MKKNSFKRFLAVTLAAATALTFAPVSTLGLSGVVEAQAATLATTINPTGTTLTTTNVWDPTKEDKKAADSDGNIPATTSASTIDLATAPSNNFVTVGLQGSVSSDISTNLSSKFTVANDNTDAVQISSDLSEVKSDGVTIAQVASGNTAGKKNLVLKGVKKASCII